MQNMELTGGPFHLNRRDANPIENVWHELKEYMRRVVKPHTKEELLQRLLEGC